MNPLTWLDELDRTERAGLAGLPAGPAGADVGASTRRAALERAGDLEPLSESEAVALLLEPQAEDLHEAAAASRRRVFGHRVRLFAPLYYSNVCANDCVYCGFRRSLGTARRRILTAGEVGEEAAALLEHGHRRILLIASEDPGSRGLDLALDAVVAVGAAAGRQPVHIALEIAPRAPDDFARLYAAGARGYVLFQETYDRRLYPSVHPAGPKADFEHRVSGPTRALEGGMRELGLGVLFGLGDPIRDTLAMIAHARHLQRLAGRPVASVSVPRLEPAEGVPFTEAPPSVVDDALWLRIISVLRLALPWTDIIVSTRETVSMRRRSLSAGATVFSAGSRTEPGGYHRRGEARAQFRLGDGRSLQEVVEDLSALGYEPTVV